MITNQFNHKCNTFVTQQSIITIKLNKGSLVEAFVGQELLAYSDPYNKNNLYYWHKDARNKPEIDYLIQIKNYIIPIEVKSGLGRTLKSLQTFLETHTKSPYAIRFSAQNYSIHNKIHSYPLYAIAKVMSNINSEMKQAIENIL